MSKLEAWLDRAFWWGLGLYLAAGLAGAAYMLLTYGRL